MLQESLDLDSDYSGRVIEYKVQLKDLYKLINDVDAYKEVLWELVTKDCIGELCYFKELKNEYSENEWLEIRFKIFKAINGKKGIDKLYFEEKLYYELLNWIKEKQHLLFLKPYEKVLAKLYPKDVLRMYEIELQQQMRFSGGRKHYQQIVYELRNMQRIAGGKEVVNRLVQTWKMQYRNRPAMLQELSRL